MNLPGGGTWSVSEAASLNEFLNTPLGKKWLWVMLLIRPVVDISNMEKAALGGSYGAGYDHFFNEIAALRGTLSVDTSSAKTIDMTKD